MSDEFIFLEIKNSNVEFILGTVYINPLSDIAHSLSLWNEWSNRNVNGLVSWIAFFIKGENDILSENENIFNQRESCDEICNKREKELVECMEGNGCILINGRTSKDSPAQFTYVSAKGKSVIDLI